MVKVGAIIRGEPGDVDLWEANLKAGSDPWVEKHGSDYILMSSSFDPLQPREELQEQAVALIDRMNGVMSLAFATKPLMSGGLATVAPDGKVHRVMFAGGASFEARFFAGSPPPIFSWVKAAEQDQLLDEALVHFGRGDAWFDMYKTLECLIERFGGSTKGKEARFLALNWLPKDEIRRLKMSANWPRHANLGESPPADLMSKREARKTLTKLMLTAFKNP